MKKLKNIVREDFIPPDYINSLKYFFALLDCETIPIILFERAARDRTAWAPTGELIIASPTVVPPWLISILNEEYGTQRTRNNTSPLQIIMAELSAISSRELLRKEISPEIIERTLLDILFTIIQTMPEPYTEILWQEAEAELWDAVESTCLPLLDVLDISDVLRYVSARSKSSAMRNSFLYNLTKFLQRIFAILKFKGHPNLLHLSAESVSYLATGPEHISSEMQTLIEMNDILGLARKGEITPQYLTQLQLQDRERNDTLQLALESSFPNLATQTSSRSMLLNPADNLKHNWSPLQVLAMTQLIGTQLIVDAIGSTWAKLDLTIRVLISFRAFHDKDFAISRRILEPAFEEVQDAYGTWSTEFAIVGTQLVLCYNALAMEDNADSLAHEIINAVWPERQSGSISESDVALIRSIPDIYFFIAYVDSLIGRGLYELANQLLLRLVDHHTSNNSVILLCILRILKITRREQSLDPALDKWAFLENGIGLLDNASSDILYQCFEEAICILSNVNSSDTTQISRAEYVIDRLDELEISSFEGSDAMKFTLQEYRQELKVYRKDFGLFSVTGPQRHYCRNIREVFPNASTAFIERIGAANWDRYQRLKDISYVDELVEPIITVDPSKCHDSGIGSSLESATLPAVTKAPSSIASKLTMSISPGPGLSDLLEVPPEIIYGKPYQCEWCGRYLKMEQPKHQWPQHVFSDLCPYICIVEDCKATTAFGSRLEYEQHLANHQFVDVSACPVCDHIEQDNYCLNRHIREAHPSKTLPMVGIPKRIPRDLSAQRCPFCAEIPGSKNFVRHVSRHCEEVALSSLSQALDEYSEDGEVIEDGLVPKGERPTDPLLRMAENANRVDLFSGRIRPDPGSPLSAYNEMSGADNYGRSVDVEDDLNEESDLFPGHGEDIPPNSLPFPAICEGILQGKRMDCVAYNTKGRKCRVFLAESDQIRALSLVTQIISSGLGNVNKLDLDELAQQLLCARWHKRKNNMVALSWFKDIQNIPEDRKRELESQDIESKIFSTAEKHQTPSEVISTPAVSPQSAQSLANREAPYVFEPSVVQPLMEQKEGKFISGQQRSRPPTSMLAELRSKDEEEERERRRRSGVRLARLVSELEEEREHRRQEERRALHDAEIMARPAVPIVPPSRELKMGPVFDQSDRLNDLFGDMSLSARAAAEIVAERRRDRRDRIIRAEIEAAEAEAQRQRIRRRITVGRGLSNRKNERILYDDGTYRYD